MIFVKIPRFFTKRKITSKRNYAWAPKIRENRFSLFIEKSSFCWFRVKNTFTRLQKKENGLKKSTAIASSDVGFAKIIAKYNPILSLLTSVHEVSPYMLKHRHSLYIDTYNFYQYIDTYNFIYIFTHRYNYYLYIDTHFLSQLMLILPHILLYPFKLSIFIIYTISLCVSTYIGKPTYNRSYSFKTTIGTFSHVGTLA